MDNKFEINPFDRAALTDFKLLAGRTDEFRRIRFILRASAKNTNRIKSILINGERGVGKTSFLNLIEDECAINNLLPIRINLTKTNSISSDEFFWYLFNQAINKVFSLGLLGGKGGTIDASIQKILNSDGIDDIANWIFKTPILRRAHRQNGSVNFEFQAIIDDLIYLRKLVIEANNPKYPENIKFLFLVDESQNIYGNEDIVSSLRYIIQSQEGGVGFVFAGDTTYKTTVWENVFGGSYRDFEIIFLPYFPNVESVSDYFKKSLASIDWTDEEIEEKLFYKFRLGCRQIFQLTSGKPAWINTIASKMFERCMAGEISQMRFDKQAQANVKKMLEESGEIDKSKLEFIENLQPKYSKWLAEVFACELSSFKQVYFFAKFKLVNDFSLSIEEFEKFCNDLIEKGIISLVENYHPTNQIGFNRDKQNKNFLEKHYYAFNLTSDTIKQWLQINSDGLFRFHFFNPGVRYMEHINDELTTEKSNAVIIAHKELDNNESFRLSNFVSYLQRNDFHIEEESYENINAIYQAFKKLENSRFKDVLYVELVNQQSSKTWSWNIYNYNDKDKIIEIRDSQVIKNRLKSAVERHNSFDEKYELKLYNDKMTEVNLGLLQRKILETKDSRKIGIILEDKNQDLVRLYVKESNVSLSFEVANFFFKLFEEGHDLRLVDLNNSAYVFIEKEKYDEAQQLLNEAIRRIEARSILNNDMTTALLVLYNSAVIKIKNNKLEEALSEFRFLISFAEANEIVEDISAVLKLPYCEEDKIILKEIKPGDKEHVNVKPTEFAKIGVKVIEKFIHKIGPPGHY